VSTSRLWRRNWKGKGKELTSGALVWQSESPWGLGELYKSMLTCNIALQSMTVGQRRVGLSSTTLCDRNQLSLPSQGNFGPSPWAWLEKMSRHWTTRVRTRTSRSSKAYVKPRLNENLTHNSPDHTAARDLGEQLVGRGEKGDARGRVFRPGRRQGRRFQVNRGCPCAQRIHRVLQGHRRGTTYQNVGFAIAQDYRRRREVDRSGWNGTRSIR
jgi:hypothetical protein